MFDSGANCFLNALVREFPQWKKIELPSSLQAITQRQEGFYFKVTDDQHLYLPLYQYSMFGRSYFYPVSYVQTDENSIGKALNFSGLLNYLEQSPSVFSGTSLGMPQQQHLSKVIERSRESQNNINKVVNHREDDMHKLYTQPLRFIESEQSLLIGHSIHPCPKSRSGFNADDEKRYVPEYSNDFQLSWFAVDKSILYIFAGNDKPIEEYCLELVQNHPTLYQHWQSLSDDYLMIPCHPWQAQHWQNNPELSHYFAQNKLINLGQHGESWRATSSLRSLYQADSPWMLKFSLSTQLTNSIRHLQPEEMIRGQVIEKVLSSDKASELSQVQPDFHIMREPISVALKNAEGKALDSTAIIWRENPFYQQAESAQSAEVLSSLLQDYPNQATNRLSLRIEQRAAVMQSDPKHIAQAFLSNFLDVVIKPIIIAQAEYGLLFGAHQQNIVLKLNDEMMPQKVYFRDCQGTGFSSLAKELYGEKLLSDTLESGNFFENDTVIHLFTYYLLINSCFNTISSLTLTNLLTEQEALDIYQAFLQQLRDAELSDPRVIDYLCDTEQLWSKGNFYCNLHAINENTMDDPFLIYHPLTNPIHLAPQPSQSTSKKTSNAA